MTTQKLQYRIAVLLVLLGMVGGYLLAPSNARASEDCFYDGELGPVAFDMGKPRVYARSPIGSAERETIVELAWPGRGFGGFDRAVVVLPRLGAVWQMNVKSYSTQAQRFFCGTGEEVTQWASKAHLPSFQQASRNQNGAQPQEGEVALIRLNYEEGTAKVVVAGRAGVAEKVVSMMDLSFHEGGKESNQPLSLVY